MRLSKIVAAAFCCVAVGAAAQLSTPDPDWKELDAPPPPAFDVSRLIPVEVGGGSSLSFGVDPATLSIGKDGIVRYVMVARSGSGAVNAMYEGIQCNKGEFKTYARYNPSGGWSKVDTPEWKSLWAGNVSRHTLRFAREGGCAGTAPPITTSHIVRDLKNQNLEKIR